MELKKDKILISTLVLSLLVSFILIFFFLISFTSIFFQNTDYPVHINYAFSMWEGNPIPFSVLDHPIYQLLIILFSTLFSLPFLNAGILVNVLISEFLFLTIYANLKSLNISPILSSFLSFGLIIATPIMLVSSMDGLNYLGYIGITNYHNPTSFLLKPFALLCFLNAIQIFSRNPLKVIDIIFSAALSILCALIKPNFTICFLPAICFFAFFKILQKETVKIHHLLFGFIVPSSAVLIWQFFKTYNGIESGIIFAPFLVMRHYSNYLIIKFLLSIWFPLLISVVSIKNIIHSEKMILAWIIFLFGFIFTYFVAEPVRTYSGNYGWSGEIALFILFVNTVIFLFEQKAISQKRDFSTYMLLIIGFLPHVIAGIYYYIQCLIFGAYA